MTVKEIPDEAEEIKVNHIKQQSVDSFYSENVSLPEKSNDSGLMSRVSDAIRVKKFSPNGNLSEMMPNNRNNELSPVSGRRSPNLRY